MHQLTWNCACRWFPSVSLKDLRMPACSSLMRVADTSPRKAKASVPATSCSVNTSTTNTKYCTQGERGEFDLDIR